MTTVPEFLATNGPLWQAWSDVQSGRTFHVDRMVTAGWEIEAKHLPNGGTIMTLSVRFDPIEK